MGPQLLFTLFAFAGGIGIGLSLCRFGDRLVAGRSPYRSALLVGALAGLATVPVHRYRYERRAARLAPGAGQAWVAAADLPAGQPVAEGAVRAAPLPAGLEDWALPQEQVVGRAPAAPLRAGDLLTPGSLSPVRPEACLGAPAKVITPVRRAP